MKVPYSSILPAINELYGKFVWFSAFTVKTNDSGANYSNIQNLTWPTSIDAAKFPTRAKILLSFSASAPADLKHQTKYQPFLNQSCMLPLNDGMIEAADPSANRFLPMMGGFRCKLSLSGGGWWDIKKNIPKWGEIPNQQTTSKWKGE